MHLTSSTERGAWRQNYRSFLPTTQVQYNAVDRNGGYVYRVYTDRRRLDHRDKPTSVVGHVIQGEAMLAFSVFSLRYLVDVLMSRDPTLLVKNPKRMVKLMKDEQHSSTTNDWSLPRTINWEFSMHSMQNIFLARMRSAQQNIHYVHSAKITLRY